MYEICDLLLGIPHKLSNYWEISFVVCQFHVFVIEVTVLDSILALNEEQVYSGATLLLNSARLESSRHACDCPSISRKECIH